MNPINRRQALLAITQVIASTSLISCSSDANDEDVTIANLTVSELETLSWIEYDLFPHDALPSELYIQVAQGILDLDSALVSDGLSQVQQATNNQAWIEVVESDRIEILRSLENSMFFALIRNTAIDVLYKTPEMFELLGYGGSAIEFGGYLNRGFDDIGWLPETELTK